MVWGRAARGGAPALLSHGSMLFPTRGAFMKPPNPVNSLTQATGLQTLRWNKACGAFPFFFPSQLCNFPPLDSPTSCAPRPTVEQHIHGPYTQLHYKMHYAC